MPPKSVTCSVCSQVVLKAQTLARTDGTRACRSHEGVVAEADAKQEAERTRINKAIEASSKPRWKYPQDQDHAEISADWKKKAAEFRERTYSHCWACDAEGLEWSEYFSQSLIAVKRLELRGEFNFLSMPQDVRKLMGNALLLAPLQLQNEVIDRAIVKHVSDRRLREIVPLLGFVLLCPPCARKHGFGKRLEDLMPKPTWEQLENMMVVVAGIEPLVRALAEKKEKQS